MWGVFDDVRSSRGREPAVRGLPAAAVTGRRGWGAASAVGRWLIREVASGGRRVAARLVVLGLVVTVALPPARAADDGQPKVDPEARRAIDGALRWLVAQQRPSGGWGERQHKVAVTGYVLMAFMAAGQLPDEGEHAAAVSRGVHYLADCVRADGYIVAPDETMDDKGMYGHGIATIALAEACGQTGADSDADGVRAKLRRAVHLIVTTQNAQGGWRYLPRVADADLSVTVLQVVALRAAKNDGIDVPQRTIDRAVAYVRSCRDVRTGGGGFAYQPGGPAGFARTAAAIYSLQVCGKYDDPLVKAGSDYLVAQQDHRYMWFTYGNFYAAPAQYMIGGSTWAKWYADVRTTLMGRVRREGDLAYWPTVDGDQSGGSPVYVTAVDTLILSLPDGYVPLYQR